ncbi:MAG: bifunctional methionine sulfoxide reductase B/A protein [Porphyromonas sp.]|nr:bifunctional methionine sulfoxide reductase B/A protein [Porphyromonas sp.]
MKKYKKLTPEEEDVIVRKGTERPFTGKLLDEKRAGTYVCKRCGAALYRSEDKFDSGCGWPSFDDEIKGAVLRVPDSDGYRVEIICANCHAHLGHVFEGEGFTSKNTRHCVNSISMEFIPDANKELRRAYFASGCFWGTEYFFSKQEGVKSTAVGFMGGTLEDPTYEDVCTGTTGHLECVEVEYDPTKVSYEQLVRLFFETHDFTQKDGQGPDIGSQYLSAIFYSDKAEEEMGMRYLEILKKKGYKPATTLRKTSKFWKAEEYHQGYYDRKGTTPYCHGYKKIF